jgi:hypothetical protein
VLVVAVRDLYILWIDVLRIVSHDDTGVAIVVELLKKFHNPFACGSVHVSSRFVCKDDWWLIHKRTGDGDALLFLPEPEGPITATNSP